MAKHFILESWISFNVEGLISNPSSFCGFYVFFRVFSFDILYVISETCNLRENNSTKINRSVMYALDSSCCRSHFMRKGVLFSDHLEFSMLTCQMHKQCLNVSVKEEQLYILRD